MKLRTTSWVDFLVLCLACALGGACGGSTSTGAPGKAPKKVKTYRVQSEPARLYDTRATDRLAPGEERERVLRETVEGSARRAKNPLAGDGRLDALAAWVLDNLEAGAIPPPHSALDSYAHHLGLPEPVPHLLVLGVPGAALAGDEIAGEIDNITGFYPYTHYGAALKAIPRGALLAVVFGWRWFEMEPVTRKVEPGSAIRLRGKTADGLRDPMLAVTLPDGSTTREPAGAGPEFDLSIQADQRGVYRVELLARGKRGATVLANFPVFAGVEEPRLLATAGRDEPGADPQDEQGVRERLFELINRDRTRAGLAPLTLDPVLDALAAAHCEDMRANGFVGHTSSTTGEAVDRVKGAGLKPRIVLENIGRGYGAVGIHEGIMQSPGHRANVLHPEVDRLGLGVVSEQEGERRSFLVTQLFLRAAQDR